MGFFIRCGQGHVVSTFDGRKKGKEYREIWISELSGAKADCPFSLIRVLCGSV
jgi:hypothetical protein